jgi:hypothetical protein
MVGVRNHAWTVNAAAGHVCQNYGAKKLNAATKALLNNEIDRAGGEHCTPQN